MDSSFQAGVDFHRNITTRKQLQLGKHGMNFDIAVQMCLTCYTRTLCLEIIVLSLGHTQRPQNANEPMAFNYKFPEINSVGHSHCLSPQRNIDYKTFVFFRALFCFKAPKRLNYVIETRDTQLFERIINCLFFFSSPFAKPK